MHMTISIVIMEVAVSVVAMYVTVEKAWPRKGEVWPPSPTMYRGAAYTLCNLRYRIPKEIPVVFHNIPKYDHHFIM